LSQAGLERARSEFADRWLAVTAVGVGPRLARAAGEVGERHRLRALDALHLATALELVDDSVVVASWDDELRRAAAEAGLAVAP